MASRQDFAICVSNRGYAAALEVRKVYPIVPDRDAQERGLIRVVDESGEDYLYPERFFVPIDVPGEAKKAFSRRSA